MSPSQIRSYSRNYGYQNDDAADILEIIQRIPTLTKIGAIFLVMGKFMGIMAIPAAFIPSLNVLVVPLIFAWGGMVFLAIALCSVDHFRKRKLETKQEKMDALSAIIDETTELRDQLLEELDQHEGDSAAIIPLTVGQR